METSNRSYPSQQPRLKQPGEVRIPLRSAGDTVWLMWRKEPSPYPLFLMYLIMLLFLGWFVVDNRDEVRKSLIIYVGFLFMAAIILFQGCVRTKGNSVFLAIERTSGTLLAGKGVYERDHPTATKMSLHDIEELYLERRYIWITRGQAQQPCRVPVVDIFAASKKKGSNVLLISGLNCRSTAVFMVQETERQIHSQQ